MGRGSNLVNTLNSKRNTATSRRTKGAKGGKGGKGDIRSRGSIPPSPPSQPPSHHSNTHTHIRLPSFTTTILENEDEKDGVNEDEKEKEMGVAERTKSGTKGGMTMQVRKEGSEEGDTGLRDVECCLFQGCKYTTILARYDMRRAFRRHAL